MADNYERKISPSSVRGRTSSNGGPVPQHSERDVFYNASHTNYGTSINGRPQQPNGDVTDDVTPRDHAMTDSSITIEITPRQRMTGVKMATLCVMTVVFSVMMNVSLPIYAGTMNAVGGDTFLVLLYGAIWFPIVLSVFALVLKFTVDRSVSLYPTCGWRVYLVMGLTTTLNGVGVVFASPPDRTAPYLQGVLATIMIPFTVLCRFVILRKGLSLRRLGCTIAVLVGIFITVEPQIWDLPGSGDSAAGGSSTAHVIWPVIFALGFLPAAINTVICERELNEGEAQSLSFMMWSQIFQLLTILPLFWVDFIPWFGMAKGFGDFGERLHVGFRCNLSSDPSCDGLALKGWMFILGYCLANLFQFLLIQKAEGAVFAVVVQSMVTPLATLFWTFFNFDPDQNHFYWGPQFTETTAFTIAGLLIIVPAIVLYNVFSRQDAREREEKGVQ